MNLEKPTLLFCNSPVGSYPAHAPAELLYFAVWDFIIYDILKTKTVV